MFSMLYFGYAIMQGWPNASLNKNVETSCNEDK